MAKFVLQVLLIDMEASDKLSPISSTELIRRPHGESGQVEIDKKIEGMLFKGHEPDTQGFGHSPSGDPSVSGCFAKLPLRQRGFSARLLATCGTPQCEDEWQRFLAADAPSIAFPVGPAAKEPGQSESLGVHVLRP